MLVEKVWIGERLGDERCSDSILLTGEARVLFNGLQQEGVSHVCFGHAAMNDETAAAGWMLDPACQSYVPAERSPVEVGPLPAHGVQQGHGIVRPHIERRRFDTCFA